MQFGKAQSGGLIALGLMLVGLQIYILFSSTQQPGSPTQAPATPTQGQQITKFIPGVVGILVLAVGGYLVLLQRKQRSNEEIQPEKTKSGFPM
jgi:hypothetical protein